MTEWSNDKEVVVLSHWRILHKLLTGAALLGLILALLAFTSFQGGYSYRGVARSVSKRATEFPLAADFALRVADLRATLISAHPYYSLPGKPVGRVFEQSAFEQSLLREEFNSGFAEVKNSLRNYREQLDNNTVAETYIDDNRKERDTVRQIEESLERIAGLNRNEDWMLDNLKLVDLDAELEQLHRLANALPSYLQARMHNFAGEVRGRYRTWIILTWVSTIISYALLVVIGFLFDRWIFRPLRVLVRESRRVAGGEFSHRIQLHTHDEMAELANAMNAMTARFQEIRDDLNQQVKLRTKEVVRSEQLASVGFLAAGVAHEINNPLASIAWSAESIERRLHCVISDDDALPDAEHNPEVGVLRKNLRRIQDQAFRCKGITEKLLDFSRMGHVERETTNLAQLVQDVVEMVQHLGDYREKRVVFENTHAVFASINPQEITQVVLNLITNALDSLDADGAVHVQLSQSDDAAELNVVDNGCGMTDEVLEHLFEPFFTRRRGGKGTGIGMSITYRIIEDHGGLIQAASSGHGCGSTIRVTLPLKHDEQSTNHEKQAA